jgi:hypothetical protein
VSTQLGNIEWLRPKQIAPKPHLAGFMGISDEAKTNPEVMNDLDSKHLIDGLRIF